MAKKPSISEILETGKEALDQTEAGLETIKILAKIATADRDSLLGMVVSPQTKTALELWHEENQSAIRNLSDCETVVRLEREGKFLPGGRLWSLEMFDHAVDELLSPIREHVNTDAK